MQPGPSTTTEGALHSYGHTKGEKQKVRKGFIFSSSFALPSPHSYGTGRLNKEDWQKGASKDWHATETEHHPQS